MICPDCGRETFASRRKIRCSNCAQKRNKAAANARYRKLKGLKAL